MQSAELLKLILTLLEDMKAHEIQALNVAKMTTITDHMIICSGTSSRHTRSIAEHLVTEVKKQGIMPLGVEGEAEGDWILVDLGDAIVHVMLPDARAFYSLERLWSASEQQRYQEKGQ